MLRDKKWLPLLLLALTTLASSRLAQAAALNQQMDSIAREAGFWLLVLGAVGGISKALWRFQGGETKNGTEWRRLAADVPIGVVCGVMGFLAADALPDSVLSPDWLPLVTLVTSFLGSHILERVVGDLMTTVLDGALARLPWARRDATPPPPPPAEPPIKPQPGD